MCVFVCPACLHCHYFFSHLLLLPLNSWIHFQQIELLSAFAVFSLLLLLLCRSMWILPFLFIHAVESGSGLLCVYLLLLAKCHACHFDDFSKNVWTIERNFQMGFLYIAVASTPIIALGLSIGRGENDSLFIYDSESWIIIMIITHRNRF